MAGDWLKWTKGFARKREVILIAAALRLDRRYVAGALMELWEWVDENVTLPSRRCHGDGVTECGTDDAVVEIAADSLHLLDGVVGVEGLAGAMASVGWLRQRNGRVELPNFFRHNGSPAKERAMATDRKRRSRQTADVPKLSRSERDKTVTREEKRRGIKGTHSHDPPASDPPPPDDPIPPPLRTEAFRAAWAEWVTRWSPGETEARNQLAHQLAPLGPDRAAECVRLSLASGWKTLQPHRFKAPQKETPNGHANRASARPDRPNPSRVDPPAGDYAGAPRIKV